MAFLSRLGNIDIGSLSMIQRVLLVTDGTLTDVLEAAFLEPIKLRKLSIEVQQTFASISELDVEVGERIMRRRVLLYGERSQKIYVYADSLVALDRLPLILQEQLLSSDISLGRLWLEHQLETFKELLHASRQPINDFDSILTSNAGTDLFLRKYRVISGGRPIIVISEHFR